MFRIENCEEPVISPSLEVHKSLEPSIPAFLNFEITAETKTNKEFECNAVLYDSDMNKLD